MRFAFCLCAALLLPACAAEYPTADLKRDILPVENEVYRLEQQWWTAYADADLDAAVRTALERNVDLARRAVAINRALYNARLIGADLVPTFSADAGASASRDLRSGDPSTRSWDSRLGVNYEIDLWQRLRHAASSREWEYAATQEDLEATRLTLINKVVDAYFELRYVNEAIALTRSNLARYEDVLTLTRTKHDLGKVAAVEPLQAEQSILSTRNNLLDLETRRKTLEQTLRDLLDARPGEPLVISQASLLDVPEVGVELEVPLAALGARPDIRAAEDRLQAAFRSAESSRTDWYPRVSIGSTLSTRSETADRFFDAPFLGGTVQISFPFLDWFRLRWQVKISEADFETARLNFVELVTRALNEVDAARFAWERSVQTLSNTVNKHEKDARIRDYYQSRYEFGAAELKDWLEAQNTADASMLAVLEAKYRVIRNENLVFQAMGGSYAAK